LTKTSMVFFGILRRINPTIPSLGSFQGPLPPSYLLSTPVASTRPHHSGYQTDFLKVSPNQVTPKQTPPEFLLPVSIRSSPPFLALVPAQSLLLFLLVSYTFSLVCPAWNALLFKVPLSNPGQFQRRSHPQSHPQSLLLVPSSHYHLNITEVSLRRDFTSARSTVSYGPVTSSSLASKLSATRKCIFIALEPPANPTVPRQ
jgi:hypothetical protein